MTDLIKQLFRSKPSAEQRAMVERIRLGSLIRDGWRMDRAAERCVAQPLGLASGALA